MKSLLRFICILIGTIIVFAFIGSYIAGDDGAIGGIVIALILMVYLFPSFVAYARKVPSKHAILALNIFLGWTLIGWVISLVWSLKNFKYSAQSINITSQALDNVVNTQTIETQGYTFETQPKSHKKSILKFLSVNEGRYTPGHISHELQISIIDTEQALSELLQAKVITRELTDTGNITYEIK